MRVYLPVTSTMLRELVDTGTVGPAPLTGFAVTPALREWYVDDDAEAASHVLAALRGAVPDARDLEIGLAMASEDVGQLATAAGVPLVYWFTGITDPELFRRGEEIPSNHSPFYAPQAETAIPVGVDALTAATRAWLS